MAADGASDGEVTLSWTNPVDDDLASVEITWTPSGTGHGSQPVEVAADANPNDSATISGLTPRTSYRFTLTTVDEGDNRSTGATVTHTATQSNSVSGLMATSGSGEGEVDLSWSNPPDTRFARVEITWMPNANEDGSQPVTVNGMVGMPGSRTIGSLVAGREYTFTLRALDGSGAVISDRQAMANAIATDLPPGDVTSPTATAHATQSCRIELSWSNPTDADLASVEIGWTPSGAGHGSQPVTVAASATPNDSASISGLTPQTSYRFTLTAVDIGDNRSAGVDTAPIAAQGACWPSSLSDTTVTATEGVEIGADISAYRKIPGTPLSSVDVSTAASVATTPTVGLRYDGDGNLRSATFGAGDTPLIFSMFVGMAPHIDAVLDDSNDSAFVEEPISRGWSWQGYGVWMDADGTTLVGGLLEGRFGAASFGAETEGAFIPTTGSATFVGRSGGYHAQSTSTLQYASGNVEAEVDFGSDPPTIALTTSGHTRVLVGGTTTGTANADLNWSGSLSWTEGSNALTGTLTAPGEDGNMLTGNAFGRFYGPNGEELGLVFDLAGLSGIENLRYIGAMGARSCAADPAPTSGPTGECP